ncbi:metal-response element-binding transcription factor 2-like isoform X1 [Haliotis asinina]|uniref:metal-response element-binding transcription factor 2-like isoform X1 n=1 Tax=Haliotis asinina TaxID=109174 RepID=UPI0035320426
MSAKGRPPGSVTQVVAGKFHVNLEVLCRWSDGLFYLGKIIKIDDKVGKCLVNFEDNSEHWVLFKDIQRGAIKGDIACCICRDERSDVPNEIVLCDNCGLGYHQQCHNPPIDDAILQPSVDFMCRLCVFATTVKRGGALKKGPTAKAFQTMKQTFPYNLNKLTWDAQHKTNSQQCYCYCGGPGDWYQQMLQCCRCRQWFHEACTQCLEMPLLCGDRFYMFVCSHCNHGPEYIKRLDMKWVDIVHLSLFNLTLEGTKKYYDLIDVILPWVCSRWDILQLDKLNCTSNKEVEAEVLQSLQTHKSRFCWGREIKKKITLWGLRVRVPPPAPTVILPTDGHISDEVMSTLQMKGRKTKTFVPIECSSPIPVKYTKRKCMDIDDSIVFKTKKAKRLLLDARKSSPDRLSQVYNGYNGCRKRSFSRRSNSHNSDDYDSGFETASHCTLDSIIPPPINFEGSNHPFKTVVERNEEIAKHERLRARLLDLSRLNSDCDNSSQCSLDSSQFSVDDESIDLISEDFEEEEQPEELPKKRSRRKNQKYDAMLDGYARKRPKKIWGLPHPVKNVVDPRAIHAVRAQEVNFQSLKSSVKQYFGAADRLAHGEKFHVLARRVTPGSKVQYLVEWEGLVS